MNMSDRFVAPRSNIFIQNFACRTMFHLLTGLSNMMFDKNVRLFIRENRARLHYRELSCACARRCYGLLCCHFYHFENSYFRFQKQRYNSELSEFIISIISTLFDHNKNVGASWGTFTSEYKATRFTQSEWIYTEAKQSSYSKLCILVPNNIIYFGLLFLIGNQTIVKL